jgi:hypothetical protein
MSWFLWIHDISGSSSHCSKKTVKLEQRAGAHSREEKSLRWIFMCSAMARILTVRIATAHAQPLVKRATGAQLSVHAAPVKYIEASSFKAD